MNLGDWATERPYKDYLPYLVAKGGLTTMTLALATRAGPAHPGRHDPARDDRPATGLRRGRKQAVLGQTPLRRFGSSERRQPADPLPARRDQLRHRLMFPRRRRTVPGETLRLCVPPVLRCRRTETTPQSERHLRAGSRAGSPATGVRRRGRPCCRPGPSGGSRPAGRRCSG